MQQFAHCTGFAGGTECVVADISHTSQYSFQGTWNWPVVRYNRDLLHHTVPDIPHTQHKANFLKSLLNFCSVAKNLIYQLTHNAVSIY